MSGSRSAYREIAIDAAMLASVVEEEEAAAIDPEDAAQLLTIRHALYRLALASAMYGDREVVP